MEISLSFSKKSLPNSIPSKLLTGRILIYSLIHYSRHRAMPAATRGKKSVTTLFKVWALVLPQGGSNLQTFAHDVIGVVA